MSTGRTLALLTVLAVVSACASVGNYARDEKGKLKHQGFLHYAPVHYLVIEPGEDGASSAKVISLPDLTKPQVMQYHPGWGSVEFSFKLQNGVLTEFGSKADSKGPETIAAVGTLASSYGALLTGQAALITAAKPAGADATGTATLTLHVLLEAANDLKDDVVEPLDPVAPNDPTLRRTRDVAKEHEATLRGFAALTLRGEDDLLKKLAEIQKEVRGIVKELEAEGKTLTTYLDALSETGRRSLATCAQAALADVAKDLREFAYPKAGLTIFEIVPRDGGGVEFLRVEL